MAIAAPATNTRGLARIFAWRRTRFVLIVSLSFGLILNIGNQAPFFVVMARALIVGMAILFMFGALEHWPRRLVRPFSRWGWQLLGIVIVIPFAAFFAYWVTTGGDPQLDTNKLRVTGYAQLCMTALLFAPWIAVGAMIRQRDAFARDQAYAFELEKSELERKALDTRLRLLQAQVEPHFLFNTLANVQALVDAGSPQASSVLKSLIAYLRAAVPRMHEVGTTLGQELDLVRAYLQLMQMRIPDRLKFALHIEPAANSLQCPPMTLLTLVENAVRHGIDPSEEGGRIDVDVWLRDARCHVRVTDTGVGLQSKSGGLGTGLSTLRERMLLAFGGDTQLRLTEVQPHGVCAELEFPARQETK
ncbi:MAG TPA: histidine kinase [Steroidobacteraceae bacterium]|jgi:signal transduction histidine kinase|nr:histidine kinase [Steroidobacteraceae bacterium]